VVEETSNAVRQATATRVGALMITIAGGGSFGTVIANIIAANGHEVRLWMRDPVLAETINREHRNTRYLAGYALDPRLRATCDAHDCVPRSEALFIAVPSSACRQVARQIAPLVDRQAALISTTKGIEAASFKLMSQVIGEEIDAAAVGVLSEPNLAAKIDEGHFTGTVIASDDSTLCQRVMDLLHCDVFRVYANPDMFGVELAGALKNIYAIAAGMAAALEVGQNSIGMLLTRSLAEMSRFAVRLGADPTTFLGLAGVGDLVVTCASPLSRNYQIGYRVAQGKTLDAAM